MSEILVKTSGGDYIRWEKEEKGGWKRYRKINISEEEKEKYSWVDTTEEMISEIKTIVCFL